jgi:hypothetical protein
MQFLQIQVAVADQLTVKQQHRNLMAMTGARGGIGIDIDDFQTHRGSFGHCRKLAEHFLTQAAAGAGIQHEMPCAGNHGLVTGNVAGAGDLHRMRDEFHGLGGHFADGRDLMALHNGGERKS